MEILRFLLSFFGDQNNQNLSPNDILEAISKQYPSLSFLKNLNLESILPLLEKFLSFNKNERPPQTDRRFYGLEPISSIADKNVIYVLNCYFSNEFLR